MRNDIRHSLQEIATKYKLVLFDTCSICDYTKNTENLSSIQQKEIESYIQYKSYTFLRNFILNGDGNTLFFIPEVISELEKARKIKFTKNFKGKRRFASFRNFSNNTKYAFARNKSFVKIIRERGLILRLTEEEQIRYNELYTKFGYLVNFKGNNLTGADYPLLIKGVVVSEIRGNTALISNDTKIFGSWVHLLRSSPLKINGNLDFFFRNGFDYFSKK